MLAGEAAEHRAELREWLAERGGDWLGTEVAEPVGFVVAVIWRTPGKHEVENWYTTLYDGPDALTLGLCAYLTKNLEVSMFPQPDEDGEGT